MAGIDEVQVKKMKEWIFRDLEYDVDQKSGFEYGKRRKCYGGSGCYCAAIEAGGVDPIRSGNGALQMHSRGYQDQFNDSRKISSGQQQRGIAFAGCP